MSLRASVQFSKEEGMTIKQKILKRVELYVMIVVTILFIGYAYFWDLPTIEVYNQPFPIQSSLIQHGDEIIYMVNFCRRTNQPAYISRTLQPVDEPHRTILLSSQISNLPTSDKDCWPDNPDFVSIGSWPIPPSVPNGCYNLRIDATYNFPFKAPQVETFYTDVVCVVEDDRDNKVVVLGLKNK